MPTFHGRALTSPAFSRLVRMLAAVTAGLLVGYMVFWRSGSTAADTVESSQIYGYGVVSLLALGLYAGTFGISLRAARADIRTVLVAVTLGVAAKAALVGLVMYGAYRSPLYLLLGIAVAQIDPLSVAATLRFTPVSQRAETILRAWSSFDDPVTVLMTVYLALPILRLGQAAPAPTASGILVGDSSWNGYLAGLAANLGFAAAASGAWYCAKALRRSPRAGAAALAAALAVGLAVLFLAVAVRFDLLLGMAVSGLYVRPPVDRILGALTTAAYYIAMMTVGFLLFGHADPVGGILLGAAAFGAQICVGYVIAWWLPRGDRARIALGQQNGLTAVTLALALQPYFPRAVPIIGVAVIVVNTVYIAANAMVGASAGALPSFTAGAANLSPALAVAGSSLSLAAELPVGSKA